MSPLERSAKFATPRRRLGLGNRYIVCQYVTTNSHLFDNTEEMNDTGVTAIRRDGSPRVSEPDLGTYIRVFFIMLLPLRLSAADEPNAALFADSGEDVIRAHHQRNGFPRAPSPGRLDAVRNRASDEDSTEITTDNATGDSAHVEATLANGQLTGNATKLRSYPFGFRQVIEQAKLIAQCDSTTKNPFPNRSTFLDISSTEIFSEALLECENVPPGKRFTFGVVYTHESLRLLAQLPQFACCFGQYSTGIVREC